MDNIEFWLGEDPYRFVMRMFMTKWKPMILSAIYFDNGATRYTQFSKGLPISEKVLTENLRELEADEMIQRNIYPEIPPRVEYTLTDSGRSAVKLLFLIYDWGYKEMERRGLDIDKRGAMYHGYLPEDAEVMAIPMREYIKQLQKEGHRDHEPKPE